jgi:hypothetical protein
MKIPNYLASAAAAGTVLAAVLAPAASAAAAPAATHSAGTLARPSTGDPVRAGLSTLGTAVPQLNAQEQAEWRRLTARPEGRAQVVAEMQAAFQGLATVGAAQPSGSAHTDLATGITGDHFWITASYADVVNGAIAVGVRACQTRLPGWLCSTAGTLLTNWASGWGSAANHGVWAAIYWAPPHVEGGRW